MTHRVIGFAAWSGTGKTTLLEQVIARLTARGLRIGAVKHAHHEFDIDQPGKDSFRLRHAGAAQTLVASRQRWALITEHRDDRAEPCLTALLAQLDPTLDLVLVEGFKHEPVVKIELHRPSLGKPLLAPGDATIIAVASDASITLPRGTTRLDLNDPEQIAEFVQRHARPLADGMCADNRTAL